MQRPGTRFTALRDGTVTLYAHTRAEKGDVIWTSSVLRWIEAEVALGARRFFLLDEQWCEIGEAYLESVRSQVERLVTDTPSVELPAWVLGDTEREYNDSVPDLRPGYVCFDRDNVRTALHRGNGVEICDLLSPDDVLIMVKRARGSCALSHLFGQAVVAVQTLLHSPEAADEFARKVAAARADQPLPEGFRPSKVVFAVLLKSGTDLTADALFPFSQVTLVQTAKMLEAWGVAVEVIAIQATPVAPSRAGIRHLAA